MRLELSVKSVIPIRIGKQVWVTNVVPGQHSAVLGRGILINLLSKYRTGLRRQGVGGDGSQGTSDPLSAGGGEF